MQENIFAYPGKITAVYFGMKMTELNKRMVGTILIKWKLDIKFYQMYRKTGQYSLSFLPFDFRKDLKNLSLKWS